MITLHEILTRAPEGLYRTWFVAASDHVEALEVLPEPFEPISIMSFHGAIAGPSRIIGWRGAAYQG